MYGTGVDRGPQGPRSSSSSLHLGLRLWATPLQGALLDVVGVGALVEDDPAVVDLLFAVGLLLGDAALPGALLLLEGDKPPTRVGVRLPVAVIDVLEPCLGLDPAGVLLRADCVPVEEGTRDQKEASKVLGML